MYKCNYAAVNHGYILRRVNHGYILRRVVTPRMQTYMAFCISCLNMHA